VKLINGCRQFCSEDAANLTAKYKFFIQTKSHTRLSDLLLLSGECERENCFVKRRFHLLRLHRVYCRCTKFDYRTLVGWFSQGKTEVGLLGEIMS